MLNPTITRTHGVCRTSPRARAYLAKLTKFLVVGGTGVLVNTLALFVLSRQAGLPLVAASALATGLATANNFVWNNRWTFGQRDLSAGRFLRFGLVSLGGLAITVASLWLLAGRLGLYDLAANLVGISLATAWNFGANVLWTWGGQV